MHVQLRTLLLDAEEAELNLDTAAQITLVGTRVAHLHVYSGVSDTLSFLQ